MLLHELLENILKPALNAEVLDGVDWETLAKSAQQTSHKGRTTSSCTAASKHSCSVDVREMETYTMVYVDLPGVDKNSININVWPQDVLHVQVDRQLYGNSSDFFPIKERFEGTIDRRIQLPKGLDKSNITASYEDGVLKIKFPKAPQLSPVTKIQVS